MGIHHRILEQRARHKSYYSKVVNHHRRFPRQIQHTQRLCLTRHSHTFPLERTKWNNRISPRPIQSSPIGQSQEGFVDHSDAHSRWFIHHQSSRRPPTPSTRIFTTVRARHSPSHATTVVFTTTVPSAHLHGQLPVHGPITKERTSCHKA